MTGAEVAQIILALATLLTALGAFIQSTRTSQKADRIETNVAVIETATNSMKDALVAATAKAALAEGTAVGLEQGRNETR